MVPLRPVFIARADRLGTYPTASMADRTRSLVESLTVDSPKTKLLADKFKKMNLESVMVIADQVDENLYLASRNLVNVLVVEPRYADPLSLVHYKKVLVTKGAMDKLKEMFA